MSEQICSESFFIVCNDLSSNSNITHPLLRPYQLQCTLKETIQQKYFPDFYF